MLGHHPGINQNFPAHVFNEQTWLLAKYTSLSGSPKVTVEGNVRAVFSTHRRQLSVWNENRMLICIDLHYAKTTVPTKDCYAIVKENNVSLCRLKFRSLPERVSFGAALADFVHVANDRGASQDVSSQGWQANQGTSSSSQAEFNSSQGKMESGTLIEPELEHLPQPTRVSTPLSGLQLSATDSSPWRCYFDKNVTSPIPRSSDPDSNFKKPALLQFIAEKKNEYEENSENYPPGEGMRSPSPIGDAHEESSILKRLNESIELFNDDHSRSTSDISETIALDGDKVKMKRDNSIILIEDEDEDVMNSIDNETEERKIEDEVVECDEGECGMTHSFIARLREIPKKNKMKDGDVVRAKEDRAQMHGQDCPCCKEYYDALGLDERERISRVDNVSRHRFVARPMPQTPPHYWEIDFPSEEEQRRRGFLNNH